MSEYICAVAQSHRRSYDLPQDQAPQCCGKPMTLVRGPRRGGARGGRAPPEGVVAALEIA